MQSTFETAFAAVQELAKDFEENRRHYLSPGYREEIFTIYFRLLIRELL